MPENEFEKQVQQKMDELRFNPSAAVWQKVEKEIAEKKRRRIIFWLPLFFVLLGGAVWLYRPALRTGKHKTENIDNTRQPNAAGITPNKNKQAKGQVSSPLLPKSPVVVTMQERKINEKTYRPPLNNNDLAIEGSSNNNPTNNFLKTRPLKVMPALIHKNTHGSAQVKKTTAPANAGDDVAASGAIKESRKKVTEQVTHRNTTLTESQVVIETGTVADSHSKNKTDQKTAEQSLLETDNGHDRKSAADSTVAALPLVALQKVKKDSVQLPAADSSIGVAKISINSKQKKGIEWGMSASAGTSGAAEKLPGFFSARATNTTASGMLNSGIPGNTSSVSSNTYTTPSGTTNSFSGSVGIFMRKPMGRTLYLLVGLNYNYYSNQVLLGSKIDTVPVLPVTAAFRNGRTATFTNQFHFIEVPVQVEKQLGTHSHFSVSGGLALSLLAGSRSLQYDQQRNIYYEATNDLNKTQLTILAGISYRFLLFKHIRIETGPSFNYHISNTFKNSNAGKAYLYSAGIDAKIFFGKKKR